MSMSRVPSSPPVASPDACVDAVDRTVVAINDEAAVYLTLAERIQGAAVGLSPAGQTLLRDGLLQRFGQMFAEQRHEAVEELLRLANEPRAA